MKKIFIVIALSANMACAKKLDSTAADANTSFASTSFEKYAGCYRTIKVNGQAVIANPNYNTLTRIKADKDVLFVDESTKNEIPTMFFTLYKGYSTAQQTDYWDLASAFLDRGSYTNDSLGDHFRYEGKLSSKSSPDFALTVRLAIDILKINETQYSLHAMRNITEVNQLDSEDTYVLEATECKE
ncbi:MAG: hypothetical protein JNL11_01520 [Bdellovibrionaceae bacterium]|nr:hypothetical protein [Pseudobdellovibrionaceae bacterium]